uniref:Uncharacterized protein n=1 Tax=Populus alba TaxID=43335 RepID=A0A4U5Q669_POPAL|nr:hypothetical protein D5086_0000146920 [Populus alba]
MMYERSIRGNELRPTTRHVTVKEQVSVSVDVDESPAAVATLEGLIAEDGDMAAAIGGGNVSVVASKNESSLVLEIHSDVSEEEGWIIIPYGELPDDWKNAPDIHSLHSLARSFVFPGEQVHILASLSAYKQDTEIITPFKVAAVMPKNGVGQSPKKQNGDLEDGSDFVTAQGKGNFDTNVSGGAARNGVSCCSLSNGDIVKSSSSVSQLFSHFRSYSMSSLPQNSAPPPQPVKAQSSKPNFDLENWDQYSSQKLWKSQKHEERLSFRGRRWWRKLEIIQPAEIHSFAADCNTDDLLCVQIKNISPEHIPDIVVDIDAITIVFEEASKSCLPSSLPIACIEAGNDHSLPDLALRRGEEHSFILKPASSVKDSKVHKERLSTSCGLHLVPNTMEGISALNADQYAIMISCRCNYTGIHYFVVCFTI